MMKFTFVGFKKPDKKSLDHQKIFHYQVNPVSFMYHKTWIDLKYFN